jgi:hypothetical protein
MAKRKLLGDIKCCCWSCAPAKIKKLIFREKESRYFKHTKEQTNVRPKDRYEERR